MNRFMLAGLLVGCLAAFTYATLEVREDSADIRGKITEIRPATAQEKNRIIGTVMVEAERKDAGVDKANLLITSKTRILKEQGDARVQTTFEDLKVEQAVEARFVEGPTVMIYPLRVEASEIVILKGE